MTPWLGVVTPLVCLATLLVLLYFAWQTRAQFRTRFARLERESEKQLSKLKADFVRRQQALSKEQAAAHRELHREYKTVASEHKKLVKENRQLLKRQRDTLRTIAETQQEALLVESLLSTLPLEYPVFFGGWSIDGFVARQLIDTLEQTRPRVVLELGSGSSTVLIAAALARLGTKTRHIAVDHQEEFLTITRRNLELQGLGGRTELWCCPLGETTPGGPPWYQGLPERLQGTCLDLVLVDGPPGTLHPEARRPAMGVLKPFFSERAVLILDDARRDEEQATVRAWQEAHPDLSFRFVKRGKGCAIFSSSAHE